MTHRIFDWPPLRDAFAVVASKKRGQDSLIELAVDIILAAPDGPDKVLAFYNFICSYDEKSSTRTDTSSTRKDTLGDNEKDREIISYYVRYHYLLFLGDLTGSNVLIGTWRKELGHKKFWADFNEDYMGDHLPTSSDEPTSPPRTRATTRKSTGGIPATKPEEANRLIRRRSEDYHWFYGRLLTPQPPSDEDNTPPPIGSVASGSNPGLPTGDPNNWDIDQGAPHNYGPQDIGFFVGSLASETADSAAAPVQAGWEGVDDPMNGTSVSAVCFRSEKEPLQSFLGDGKSHSAPVPPSTAPRRRKRRKAGLNPKKKPPKKPNRAEGAAAAQPMSIDAPVVADLGPEPGPSSLKLPSPSPTPSTPIVQEFRVPFSTSCVNIPLPRSALGPNSDNDPLPDGLKEPNDTPAVVVPGFSRPVLSKNPPIWAQSRQELCESCHFFKSYQGGVYFSSGYAKGYLLSCFGAMRDIWQDGGRLIISHGGGKAASKSVEADHQSFCDPSVNALVKNFDTKEPLVLIADDKYEHFPFDLTRGHDGGKGYAYVVLGYYFVRHYWAEKHPADNGEGRAVRFKFAFQYCGEGEPWWTKTPAFPPTTLSSPTDAFQAIYEETCSSCGISFPQVYEQGWMCLRPGCESHFQLCGVDATTADLTYTKAFLAARPNPKVRKPAVRVSEPVLEAKNGIVTTPLFYHGWHCNSCGRLSCRIKWEQWECSSCGLVLPVKGRIRGHKEFWGLSPNVSFDSCDLNPVSGITKISILRDQIGTLTFILPHNRGKIYLISGSARYNTEANEIFKEFQEHANNATLPFRRFPMKSHICRGEFLTNYFSQNSGEPYQYVGSADRTLPFDQCPPCVHRALDVIRTRAAIMLGEYPPFNELLTAAYMEKQSMGFHTDGERGLGPVVASLSMGSPAIMKFRTMEDRKTIVLSLVLRHGDVLVMEGATIQAVYEHTVCPIGFRIAVTAREIRPENSTRGAWR